MLDWADDLLKTYSNRRAIVGSHYIMEVGENAPMSSEGLTIYNALKDNPNLFLMLCGHMHGEGKRYDDYKGRRVWTMIADFQGVDGGTGGWLRLLRFLGGQQINVKTYSPTATGRILPKRVPPAILAGLYLAVHSDRDGPRAWRAAAP